VIRAWSTARVSAVIFGGYGAVPPHALHALVAVVVVDFAGCAVLALPRLRWWCLVPVPFLIGAGIWWLAVNQPVEGGIVHVFEAGKGISVADLTGVLAWSTALAITVRYVLQSRLSRSPRKARHSRPPRP
jgi:hypothetical protein